VRVHYCHHFVLPLPDGHRFPMDKYARLYDRVARRADTIGLELVEPLPASDDDLLRVHSADYVERATSGRLDAGEIRRIGFPWSPMTIERSRRSSGATIAALRSALAGDGVGVNLAGGTHHASAARGGGYCIFNDAAIAARNVQAARLAERILIVDLDVHHGDGTASIFADDPSVFTFSMHAARNYPSVKPPGDLDVALADGIDDVGYLDRLARYLPEAIGRASANAVIYLAGADPYAGDRLGYLSLSKAGLRERDRFVLETCRLASLPVAVAMAGGYAQDVEDIVDIHEATVLEAAASARKWQTGVLEPFEAGGTDDQRRGTITRHAFAPDQGSP
jgi:acetoin utilization deacetylase AcuC-like enzyme